MALLISEHGMAENISLLANILQDITRDDDFSYSQQITATPSTTSSGLTDSLAGTYSFGNTPVSSSR